MLSLLHFSEVTIHSSSNTHKPKNKILVFFFRLGKMNFDAINSMKYKQQLTVIFGIWRTGAAGVCVADEHGSGG